MQKIISALLLLISLFLLTMTLADSSMQLLDSLPPFSSPAPAVIKKEQTLTGNDFSLPETKSVPNRMYAKAYCLLDADTRRVLVGEKENEALPMASTTKIMTCIIALEHGNPDSKVKVSSYAASMPDVQLNMQSGDSFYLRDLLYSLMLESHNDTAVAIAEHIAGSVEEFAVLMNEKAKELGCTDTQFVTPNGLDAEGHYTTARELCIIASYAIENEAFLKIIQTPSHQFQNCKGTRSYSVYNHDAFLTSYSGAIGIKTGFTGKAGYCFCGAAKRDGKTLITSVLACGWPPNKGYKWIDTNKLMDYGFQNFDHVTIQKESLTSTLPVTNGIKSSIAIKQTSAEHFSLMLCRKDTITIKYDLPSIVNAPVRKGDIIGYEEYYLNKERISRSPIVADETISKRTLSYYGRIVKNVFFWNT